jgi:putative transposase
MSRKGNYYNATTNSFCRSLKWELVYRRDFAICRLARTVIFDFIECFYNTTRTHMALDYFFPVDFELKNNLPHDPIFTPPIRCKPI